MSISSLMKPIDPLFIKKLESIQYNACLAINAAIRRTSAEKQSQELGLEPKVGTLV